jgi:Rtf2 RING-finger
LKVLIDKAVPAAFSHIARLKDVKDLKVTENSNPNSDYPLICPLSRMEFNGLSKFVFLWGCGCMMTEKTLLSSVKAEGVDKLCPSCGKEFKSKDVVPLNEAPEDIEAKREVLLAALKVQSALKELREPKQQDPAKVDREDPGLGKRDLESYLLPEVSEKPIEHKKSNILDSLAGENNVQGQKGKVQ